MWRLLLTLVIPGSLAFLGSVGCEASIPNGTFACSADEPCPPGFECVDAVCLRDGVDSGPRDAGIDSAMDDARIDDAGDAEVDSPADGGTDTNCGCGEDICVGEACCRPLTSIAGNYDTVCGITTRGELNCWGSNNWGQIGAGDVHIENPTQVTGGPSRWSQVDSGGGPIYAHTCGIGDDAELYCWGANNNGQLGLGDTTDRERPTAVTFLGAGWSDVTTGNHSTCGIHDGQLYCWGNPANGRLGILPRPTDSSPNPIRLTPHLDWSDVDCDGGACCAIRSERLFCWGRNTHGQVGNGETDDVDEPTEIDLGTDRATSVSCGEEHCCVLTPSAVYCWGREVELQLGVSTQSTPSMPAPIENVLSVSAGKFHTCAIATSSGDAQAWCWGAGGGGRLGIGSMSDTLMPTSTEFAATSVAAGNEHTCAIDAAGALRCWGIEPGSAIASDVPVPLCVPLP